MAGDGGGGDDGARALIGTALYHIGSVFLFRFTSYWWARASCGSLTMPILKRRSRSLVLLDENRSSPARVRRAVEASRLDAPIVLFAWRRFCTLDLLDSIEYA